MARRAPNGQAALVVVVTCFVLFAAITAGLAELGRRVGDRARAQTAADAAALASVEAGRAAAVRIAARNGGVLIAWRLGPGPDEVTVTVEVAGERATARASDAP